MIAQLTTASQSRLVQVATPDALPAEVLAGEGLLRAEVYSSERLERHASDLAQWHQVEPSRGGNPLLRRLGKNARVLQQVFAALRKAAAEGRPAVPAGEWLLDNHHQVRDQIALVRRHLPRGYSRTLPRLAVGDPLGLPRVYALALELIAHADGRVDNDSLTRFIAAYQRFTPLSLGELWAVPIMLRLALIENLRRVAVRVERTQRERAAAQDWAQRVTRVAEENPSSLVIELAELARADADADADAEQLTASFVAELHRRLQGQQTGIALVLHWLDQRLGERHTTVAELIRNDQQQLAADHIAVENAFASLRRIGSSDWRAFVEGLSPLEASLASDPAGIYLTMDAATRDHYRQQVENLARRCPGAAADNQLAISATVLSLARAAEGARADNDPTAPRTHVGWWLIGDGRGALETRLAHDLDLRRPRAAAGRPATLPVYALPLTLLTMVGALAGISAIGAWQAGMPGMTVLALLLLWPVSQAALHLVNWLATGWVRPRALPRLDFTAGVPATLRTAVVVPTMLRRREELAPLLEGLLVRALANTDPQLVFVLLTDGADAPTAILDGEEELLAAATQAIADLNAEHPPACGTARFLLLHRHRAWDAGEGVWMGRERKRGKLEDFNRLLRTQEHLPWRLIAGDQAALEGVRLVITLDTDTRLPRDAAQALISAIAHPLIRPRLASDGRHLVGGHALLQPRPVIDLTSAQRSRFSQWWAGDPGLDPYTRTVSDVYQDLFDAGSYIGKGIYDLEAFDAVLADRLPADAILSHDLIEGSFTQAALASDVLVVEDFPTRYLADVARRKRWIRGDWQLLPWLFPTVPTATGREPNQLSALARWKLADNLRRSLLTPATLAFLVVAWLMLPPEGAALASLLVAALTLLPVLLGLASGLSKPRDLPWSAQAELVGSCVLRSLATAISELAFLPFEALTAITAVTRTLWRLLVTRQHLLEWQTSCDAERLAGAADLAAVLRTMASGPLTGAAGFLLIAWDPALLPAVLPFALLWLAGPFLAWWLSRGHPEVPYVLNLDERREIALTARRTWRYFAEQVGPDSGWLPPDNVQDEPVAVTAMRTSPTNIGLALLAELAAHDFGWSTTAEMLRRTAAILNAMRELTHCHGHLLNWYNLSNREPLVPRYISMVDSGNLAGHLLVLAAGLRESALLIPDHAVRLRGCAISIRLAADELVGGHQLRPQLLGIAQRLEDGAEHGKEALAVFTEVHERCRPLAEKIAKNLAEKPSDLGEANAWFTAALGEISGHRQELADWDEQITELARQAEELARLAQASALGMQWDFLFDQRAKLFAIGYHVDDARLDRSRYDLLASEARLGSYVAIASGQIPQEHWFRLGRTGVRTSAGTSLVSWSGTLFEYLMPSLVMPELAGTLLADANRVAVAEQIRYARNRGVPWGISESAYLLTDAQLNWQYRAFGVPGLGLKRGLGDDLVIAPYASALALPVVPHAALINLRRLAELDAVGRYGHCEAIDFTPSRLPISKTHAVIRSWMVHHQGMVLLACDQVLNRAPMQRRFLADPMLQAHRLLLQERPVTPAAHADDAGPESQERPAHAPTLRVVTDPCGALPEIHLLSNGRYHVLVSAAGGGVSRWQDLALTRWREDPTRDQWGPCCYLRDIRSGALWATAYQPLGQGGEDYEAIFTQAKAEFRRTDYGIIAHTEIIVSPEDDMELRRVTLTNRSDVPRTIEVTTYAEPVLAPAATDLAHPAFSNLFIETELLDDTLLASRRPRSSNEPRRWLVHQLLDRSRGAVGPLSCETERVRFLGRGHTTADAQAFNGPAGPLSGSLGAVLDPVLALRRTVTIAAGGRAVLDIVYAVAESRTAATALAERYRDVHLADRARSLAVTHGQVVLAQLGVSEAEVQAFARIAGSLVYASSHRRAGATAIMRNRRTRSGLWSSGISGDLPICLLRISDGHRLELVRDLVQAHAWWRSHGLAVDLVVLIEDPSVYRQELSERVMAMVTGNDPASLLDRPAGIFVRRVDQLPEEDRHLLTTYARVVISDAGGTLIQFAERRLRPAPVSPKLEVTTHRLEAAPAPAPRHELLFNNGLGGFTRDGREYIITLPPQAATPAPWCNVLANPGFGTVVSERGAAYTWSENCHEFRLTPWRCDAVTDPAGEALYLRDEESGVAWSPTIGPRRGSGTYVVRHGFGYSAFTSDEEAIACEMHHWVDAVDPLKHYSLHLRNRSRRPRRISTWLYLEWTLGEIRERTGMHLVTAHEDGILLANNPLHDEFSGRHAFACASRRPTSWTCDRSEFLGRGGGPEHPAALQARGLLGRSGAGLDACAALHIVVELEPGQEQRVVFTIGAGGSRAQALTLARQHQGVSAAEASLARVYEYWKDVLGRVQVQTSDKAFDVLINGWLPYQVIAARIFARSGFSQSGGAFGFRDQLQDAMALVHHAPQLLREQLLRAASRQFTEGDVQHWWHPPQGRGVRTRISDDFLWLPYALARYVMATGDRGILEVRVPFLHGPQVPEGQDSLYDLPQVSNEQGTLYEHAVRAILRGLRYGVHDLPLMGTGDWNDGMDRVGAHGKGESVWLGFFLADVLQHFAPVAELTGDMELAKRITLEVAALGKRLDTHAWDGGWYLRAWFDDGTPLGGKEAKECRIDALPQAWAALSGVTDAQRTRTALAAVDRDLVRTEDGLIQLFDPPFGSSPQTQGSEGGLHPGYIMGYVPGVRENGGQYTHAAVWTAMAHAALGDGRRALELARLINPVRHASDAAGCARWRGEPYVMAADVYRSPGHVGQAGWTWYTGSAGWMWRLLAESLLGLEVLDGVRLRCRPTTPADFGDFTITYRHGEAVYNLTVTGAGTVRRVLLDGRLQADDSLPLERSAGTHAVRIEREMKR
jgi:cyclic beta-1,2-glucan synthetase